MKCSKCGSYIKEGSTFCDCCGSIVEINNFDASFLGNKESHSHKLDDDSFGGEKVKDSICPYCGFKLPVESGTCDRCGSILKIKTYTSLNEEHKKGFETLKYFINTHKKIIVIMILIGVFLLVLFTIFLMGYKTNDHKYYSENAHEYGDTSTNNMSSEPTAVAQTTPTVNLNKSDSDNVKVVATYYVVNCNEWITLRSTPSTSASSLAHIPLGQAVGYIENAGNGFYKISYDGMIGYGLASYLSTSKPNISNAATSETSSPAEKTAQVVNCNEWITLRSTPSTSASSLAHIPLGAYVTYIGTAENGFYCIEYNGQRGYALQSYIALR